MEGPRRDMVTWIRRVILPVAFPGESFPELQDLKETQDMLAERVKQWPKQWMAEGRQEGLLEGKRRGFIEGEQKGRAEGEQKGRAEGERKGRAEGERKGRAEGERKGRAEGLRATVRLQIERKFGELSLQLSQQLDGAGEESLLLWAQRVLDADSADKVFQD